MMLSIHVYLIISTWYSVILFLRLLKLSRYSDLASRSNDLAYLYSDTSFRYIDLVIL